MSLLIFFLVIIILGLLLGIYRYQKSINKVINKQSQWLKKNGIKIEDEFSNCEILSSDFYEEDDKGEKILKHICVIRYIKKINNKNIVFNSPNIYLSKYRLLEIIDSKKVFVIFVNPNNESDYYFDLEFMIEFII